MKAPYNSPGICAGATFEDRRLSMAKRKTKSASVIGDHEYDVTRIRDKDGKLRSSRGNGDAVANAMLIHKAGGGEIDAIIRANKLTDRMKPHAKKQDGLKRMTLGVMLRGLVNNGTPVKIGSVVVKSLKQRVALPKVEKLNGERRPSQRRPKAARKAATKMVRKVKRRSKSHSVDNVSNAEAA